MYGCRRKAREGHNIVDKCHTHDLAIRWHTELPSTVMGTPLVADLFSDGRKDVIVPGFRHGVFSVDARSGAVDTDFEAFHRSTVFSSPLMYDMDLDGVLDILIPTYGGRIEVFKDTGVQSFHGFSIPRLQVKRNWFEGLNLDPNDHSDPDVGAVEGDDSGVGERRNTFDSDDGKRGMTKEDVSTDDGAKKENAVGGGSRRSLLAVDDGSSTAGVEQQGKLTDEASKSFEEIFADENKDGDDEKDKEWLDDEDEEVLEEDYEYLQNQGQDTMEESGEEEQGKLQYGDYHQDDYVVNRQRWDEDFDTATHGADEVESPYVWIDPHIQTTPVIADIDKDGNDEIIIPVSYFFDPGEYAANSHLTKFAVGENGDTNKYMASGVVVYELHSRRAKWSQHLDLSTSYTRYKALAMSTPAVADINKDGKLEVIIGTSMGFLYVLDAETGKSLEGWPIQMGDIQGHVAVADIDQDGMLEIVAADTRGSIAAFRADASEVWERHIGSAFTAGVTFGDVNADGQLEAAFATNDGRVYLIDAATGITLKGFPFRTFGKVTAPVLITKLDTDKIPGMQLVVTSHDGYLYAINWDGSCASTVDLGEASDAMVLADDLSGTGRMDLLATTIGGNMYSIRSASKYHPLKSRTALIRGPGEAGYATGWNWAGIYAVAGARIPRDVRGATVQVRFTVMDKRPSQISNVSRTNSKTKPSYHVSVTLVGVGIQEMNAGNAPVIGLSQTINATGTYTMDLPCPRSRTTATIKLEMKDDHGSIFTDEYALSFHIHFYRFLKWLVVGPLCLMSAAVLVYLNDRMHLAQLPS